jgi:excisionase family DNA binding protein
MMLKVTEVASYLRVTRQMVYQVIREGGIKPVRVGKALRISRETLRDFIAGTPTK